VTGAVWLELPCPSCGEYALEADVVMRDVSTAERALTQLAQRLRVTLDTAHEGPRTLEVYAARASSR